MIKCQNKTNLSNWTCSFSYGGHLSAVIEPSILFPGTLICWG